MRVDTLSLLLSMANVSSNSDYVNLVFKFSRLNDVIDSLNIDYLKKLYDYLNISTRFFSPLRHELRKLFKARISSENNKVKKFFQ